MGTRSTVKFIDEYSGDTLCSIYQQYDGYPEGVGKELAEFLSRFTVVNGITLGDNINKANGIGCLSAQYIAHIKIGIGNVYMAMVDNEQEYNYVVKLSDTHKIVMTALSYDKKFFTGSPQDFLEWLKTFEEVEES